MRKHKGLFVGILLSVIALMAFGGTYFIYQNKNNTQTEQKMTVVTSFYPMYIAAMNICDGVDSITLQNLSEPQTGCLHDYQLTPADMQLLATADVFVVNGGGIEEFLSEVAESYPDLVIVDASENITLLEENSHVWMSVSNHIKQVQNIAEGLAKVDENHSAKYRDNANHYIHHLQALEESVAKVREITDGQSVVLFHEAYEYVAQEFGLEVSGVMDLDEERQVSAGEVAEIMTAIEEKHVSVVLAESTYGKEMGDMIENETEAQTVYLETLVRGAYKKDSYLQYMRENIAMIQNAFQ